MDVWDSIWARGRPRQRLLDETEYSLLDHASGRSSHEHDHEIPGEGRGLLDIRTLQSTPVISFQTEPNFAIICNVQQLRRQLLPFALSLLPSFMYAGETRKPRKLSRTSYLDGLRGVASLFVVFHHYSLVFAPSSPQGWHSGPEGQNNWFFQLPLIRVIHSGRFMVAIFFVISGYVLSFRSLKLARDGKPIELLDSLAGSVFRRWLRLHIPVILSTFIGFMMCRWALWVNLPPGWEPAILAGFAGQTLPGPAGTFMEQFWDWYSDTQQLVDPFRYGAVYTSKYNINILWTIPLEWMGSMLVFITVLCLSRVKIWVKFAVLTYLIYWSYSTSRWEPATFLCGTLLAELSFTRASASSSSLLSEKPCPSSGPTSKYRSHIAPIFWTVLFFTALFIGSQPQDLSSTSPGYRTLMYYLPAAYGGSPDIFYPSVAAPFLVLSLEHAPFLQRLFTTRFAQYLGDISFSLYMLHALVLFSLGQSFVPKCLAATGGWRNGQAGFVGGMLLAALILVPVTFWVADVFSRHVDERSVRFARWVGDKCKMKEE